MSRVDLPIPRRLPSVMLAVVAFLIIMSTVGQFSRFLLGHPKLMGFVPAFYLDYESNIPTWWSSFALAICAALAALIAWASAGERERWHWVAISGVLLFLSMDEVAMIHEYPIDPMRDAFGFGGALYYPWVIPGAALVLVVGLSFARFAWRLPRATSMGLVAGGMVFVGGAICVEMISGMIADAHGENTFAYAMTITVEEALEMLGVVLVARTFVRHLHNHCKVTPAMKDTCPAT